MNRTITLFDQKSDGNIKSEERTINGSKNRFLDFFTNNSVRYKNDALEHLYRFIYFNSPQSSIIGMKDSVKITYREVNKFTIIQLFFEKTKIVLRHNLKPFDHMIMSEPDLEFINEILKEIKLLGYHQLCKENDEIHSTCRIEFLKGK